MSCMAQRHHVADGIGAVVTPTQEDRIYGSAHNIGDGRTPGGSDKECHLR